METFEDGKTTVMQFMECMEDVLSYIDRFTCGHEIILDVPSKNRITPQSSRQVAKTSSRLSDHTQTLIFEITRTRKSEYKNVIIEVNLDESLVVQTCTIQKKEDKKEAISDRSSMRDYICKCFVPVLSVFPILHLLLADKVV